MARMAADGGRSERTWGLWAVLSSPVVYETFQRAVGAPNVRRELVATYLRARPGDRMIDIGCGPADILGILPDVDYVGFDPSERYVASARQRYGDRGRFLVGEVGQVDPAEVGAFDLALAKGVLHHIDDDGAAALFAFAAAVLRPGGRLVTVDSCFSPAQSPMARFLISRDRGACVRTIDQYRRLALGSFDRVDVHERHDLLRIPYSHGVLECHQP